MLTPALIPSSSGWPQSTLAVSAQKTVSVRFLCTCLLLLTGHCDSISVPDVLKWYAWLTCQACSVNTAFICQMTPQQCFNLDKFIWLHEKVDRIFTLKALMCSFILFSHFHNMGIIYTVHTASKSEHVSRHVLAGGIMSSNVATTLCQRNATQLHQKTQKKAEIVQYSSTMNKKPFSLSTN